MVKQIAKLISALNSNLGRDQIAAGFSWGVLLGLIPAGNIFWIALFVVSFFFKHHHPSKGLILALLKIASPLLAPQVDVVGWQILYIEALQPLFTTMYNMPFVPLTRFNNTLVAGGLVCGLVLWLPVYVLVYRAIPLYRNNLAPKIRDSKIVQSIKKAPLFVLLSKAVKAFKKATGFIDKFGG
jgi:uncharacterized protein (TIGR03546 family)